MQHQHKKIICCVVLQAKLKKKSPQKIVWFQIIYTYKWHFYYSFGENSWWYLRADTHVRLVITMRRLVLGGGLFLVIGLIINWYETVRAVASIPPRRATTCFTEFFFPPLHNHRRPSVLTLEWRSVLLDGCCLRLRLLWTASLHPQLGALHPCGPSGMVRSRRTCHCHSGGDGSRSVSAEGWREAEGGRQRRKASSTACHCSAAAAEPHREHLPSPFPRHNLFTKTPRGPVRGFFYER